MYIKVRRKDHKGTALLTLRGEGILTPTQLLAQIQWALEERYLKAERNGVLRSRVTLEELANTGFTVFEDSDAGRRAIYELFANTALAVVKRLMEDVDREANAYLARAEARSIGVYLRQVLSDTVNPLAVGEDTLIDDVDVWRIIHVIMMTTRYQVQEPA